MAYQLFLKIRTEIDAGLIVVHLPASRTFPDFQGTCPELSGNIFINETNIDIF